MTWDSRGPVEITVDPSQVGGGPAVVHELLHVVLCKELRGFSPELEEYIIAALEPELWKYISNNPKRLPKWRTAIAAKINGPEDE